MQLREKFILGIDALAEKAEIHLIPILYEDALNYRRNEPRRTRRTQRRKERNSAQLYTEMVLLISQVKNTIAKLIHKNKKWTKI